MRSAKAAVAYSLAHTTIPYDFIDNAGRATNVDDLECARSVMNDYGIIPVGWASFPTATSIWTQAGDKHSDLDFPDGALLCFPNPRAGKSGHIALGYKGMAITTPIWLEGGTPYQTKQILSVAEVARKCGNAYAGWAGDFAGHAIDFTSTAGTGAKPFPEEKDLNMELRFRITEDSTLKDTTVKAGQGWYFRDLATPLQMIAPTSAGSLQWKLAEIAGVPILDITGTNFDGYMRDHNPRVPAAAGGSAWNPTPDQLAAIGAAVPRVDVAALVKLIDAADDDEHAALLAAVQKPRTLQ